MIRRICIACIPLLALASCGGNLAPIAASLTPAVVSAETVASLRTWCARGQPLIDMARGQAMIPAAREIADTVAPYCATLTGGQVPTTTDANTTAWLPANIAGLAATLGLSLR